MSIYEEVATYVAGCLNSRLPSEQPSTSHSRAYNPVPSQAPIIINNNSYPAAPVIVNNYVPAPAVSRRSAEDKEKKDDSISSAQVLGVAAVATVAAVGLSYLAQEDRRLTELKNLKTKCENQLAKLKKPKRSGEADRILKIQIFASTIDLLELDINRASSIKLSKQVGVGSFGFVTAGSILSAGFLTSILGVSTLAVGCVSIVYIASNYFNENNFLYNLRSIASDVHSDLKELSKAEEAASRLYPSAPPAAYANNFDYKQ